MVTICHCTVFINQLIQKKNQMNMLPPLRKVVTVESNILMLVYAAYTSYNSVNLISV